VKAQRGFEMADEFFGEIPRGPGSPQVTAPQVAPASQVREVIYDNVQFPRVYIFHHAPALGHPGFAPADVLGYVMSEGKSSRLYRRLIYEKRIAQDVSFQVWPTQDCGLSFIVATARPGVTAEDLESEMLETLAGVQAGDIGQEEALGGVNRALRGLVKLVDGVGNRSDAIATATTFLDRPEYLNELFGDVESVTPESMLAVANQWFVPDRRTTLYVLPENGNGGGR
jgi:zinc protease